MIEGRCVSCDFWKNVGPSPHQRNMVAGDCTSEEALACISGYFLSTTGRFGCPLWKRREPDLREELVQQLFLLWRDWSRSRVEYEELSEWDKERLLDQADKMIAVCEKHQ